MALVAFTCTPVARAEKTEEAMREVLLLCVVIFVVQAMVYPEATGSAVGGFYRSIMDSAQSSKCYHG